MCLNQRFFGELLENYNCDSPLYFTVGKGLTNGYKPYSELYENKPPMIFVLAAISFACFGNYYLCNIVSFICLISLTLVPLVFTILLFVKNKEKNILFAICLSLLAYLISIVFASYAQERSGIAQIEMMGSGFLCVFYGIIYFIDSKKVKFYSPSVIISGFILMMSFMLKEPFGVIAIFGTLLFIKSKKDLIYKFLLPFGYSFAFALLIFICTGSLIPYLTVYLPHMFNSHISVSGSPFDRMKDLNKIFDDVKNYSTFLTTVILVTYIGTVAKFAITDCWDESNTFKKIFLPVTKIGLFICLIYATSFSVGVGGHYFWHHYIFAYPTYLLCILFTIDAFYQLYKIIFNYLNNENNWGSAGILQKIGNCSLIILLTLPMFISTIATYQSIEKLPNYSVNETQVKADVKQMKDSAKYLDSILDILNEEHYQYVGFNGPVYCVYTYTKHTPLGPIFVQDAMNFQTLENNYFVDTFKEQLSKANIVVRSLSNYDTYNLGVLTDEYNEYIANNFVNSTSNIEINNLPIPDKFYSMYSIYYRK